MKKLRLDILLSDASLASSLTRTRASSLIMEGKVSVNGNICTKPGTLVNPESSITVEETNPYVSRGGLKLKGALEGFNLSVKGKKAMDIGASTGGFTDCLLKEGADFIYCVDVGYGQLHYSVRNNEKIKNIENMNIKYLRFEEIGEKLDLAVCDVSFISLKKVFPHILKFLKNDGLILSLVKPQFETENKNILKKGVIKDENMHKPIIDDLIEFSKNLNLATIGVKKSCIKGKKGNTEFFILLSKGLVN
ncbi:MAG: TlyA family RNA methyltransferase [Deltaproteobacteria bacterium]|nr:TlyA family RNA methyltransferase [Deltaproteobacteria bacterium]